MRSSANTLASAKVQSHKKFMTDYLNNVEKIATDIVAKNATEVDLTGAFPQAAIDALRDTGMLGLINAKNVGGLGPVSYTHLTLPTSDLV